jgi:hypothetical protein
VLPGGDGVQSLPQPARQTVAPRSVNAVRAVRAVRAPCHRATVSVEVGSLSYS